MLLPSSFAGVWHWLMSGFRVLLLTFPHHPIVMPWVHLKAVVKLCCLCGFPVALTCVIDVTVTFCLQWSWYTISIVIFFLVDNTFSQLKAFKIKWLDSSNCGSVWKSYNVPSSYILWYFVSQQDSYRMGWFLMRNDGRIWQRSKWVN